jgi:hypothetical protein
MGPLGTSATEWPIVPAWRDYDDGEFCGMMITVCCRMKSVRLSQQWLQITELLGLFWTPSIVFYVEDKRPRFGDWICLCPQVDGAG